MIFEPSNKSLLVKNQLELVGKRILLMNEKCAKNTKLSEMVSGENCLNAPYLTPGQVIDPWGVMLSDQYFEAPSSYLMISSSGADKKFGTYDDVTAKIKSNVIVISSVRDYPISSFMVLGSFVTVFILIGLGFSRALGKKSGAPPH